MVICHSRPAYISNVHQERFIGLDCGVSVNCDGERVGRLSGGNKLIRQILSDVIIIGRSCGVVLGSNVESNLSPLSGRGQGDGKSCRGFSTISLGHCHVINGEIRRRAARTVVGGRA